MPDPTFVILYVDSVPTSTVFYADLLARPPVESSPSFAMFALESGVMLGLWSSSDVKPPCSAAGQRSELAITLQDGDAVRGLHADWSRRGLTIAQAPTKMDFGETFVALDPDGHRLRVFAPSASQPT